MRSRQLQEQQRHNEEMMKTSYVGVIIFVQLFYVTGTMHVGCDEHGVITSLQNSSVCDIHTGSRYSIFEALDIVKEHNEIRRTVIPRSGDMKHLEWDASLASMAQEWSNRCFFGHGQPWNHSPYKEIGQNLFVSYGSQNRPNVTFVTNSWLSEEQNYIYKNNTCNSGKMCSHYLQLIWAETESVGCGLQFCEDAQSTSGKIYYNAWIVTCNYGPRGNYIELSPYKSGQSCHLCSSGQGFCDRGLCRPCRAEAEICECNLSCSNCGTLNTSSCSCDCGGTGFYGPTCSEPCEDSHPLCRASPGWPTRDSCAIDDYVPRSCPLMCGVCETADPYFRCEG